MATITEARVRDRARRSSLSKSATASLNEAARTVPANKTYDVFLSHCVRDAEIVLGVKLLLEDYGRTVYVDWIEDEALDRSSVTPTTAQTIRARMRRCTSLLYIHTENSGSSKWMPWELGYFDGFKGAVAIFPVTKTQQASFVGQEYLGLYPYVDEMLSLVGTNRLRVRKSLLESRNWQGWVADPASLRKTA